MVNLPVYSIGRGAQADIKLNDAAVSRLHAELVVTRDGKYYLTDCASTGGTYVVIGGEKKSVTQGFVEQHSELYFGGYHTSVQQLLVMINELGDSGKGELDSVKDSLPDGPVRRDPNSGEIISEND